MSAQKSNGGRRFFPGRSGRNLSSPWPALSLLLAAICLTTGCGEDRQTGKDEIPAPDNIVFVLLDAARADHFSGYGYGKNTTPRIDAISSKGAVFLQVFSPATATLDSIPRIMSSRYFSLPVYQDDAFRWGIKMENPAGIFKQYDEQQVFLPQVLSAEGYTTALFHNHAGIDENSYLARQFDESFVFSALSPTAISAEAEIVSAVIDWIRRNREKRFFIYCHLMSPHQPYLEVNEDRDLFPAGDFPHPRSVISKINEAADLSADGWSREELEVLVGLYDSKLKDADRQVGRLYDELTELGLGEKTLLIVTSDHGENLGEHNHLGHSGPPWDSCTHIPLIMVYPPRIPPEAKVTGLGEAIDIAPTILELCGINLPAGKAFDGESLLAAVDHGRTGREQVFTYGSIRTSNYKYIFNPDLLYDLEKDPGEENNIADRNPLIKQNLRKSWEQSLLPLRERLKESRRTSPPDFTFYYPSRNFTLTPQEVLAEFSARRNAVAAAREASAATSWRANKDFFQYGLYFFPLRSESPPLVMSAAIPNGSYRVSLLLETPAAAPVSPETLGLEYRFNDRSPFLPAAKIQPVDNPGEEGFYCYVDLAETEVKEENIRITVKFSAAEGEYCVIRHVKFTPAGISREKDVQSLESEERRRRTRNLKSLGYL